MNTARYVTCRCQHCDGGIEFDGNLLAEENSVQPCPHCGLETLLFLPSPSPAGLPIKQPPPVPPPPALPQVEDSLAQDLLDDRWPLALPQEDGAAQTRAFWNALINNPPALPHVEDITRPPAGLRINQPPCVPPPRALLQFVQTTAIPPPNFAAKLDAITPKTTQPAVILSAPLQHEPQKAPPVPKTPPAANPVPQITPPSAKSNSVEGSSCDCPLCALAQTLPCAESKSATSPGTVPPPPALFQLPKTSAMPREGPFFDMAKVNAITPQATERAAVVSAPLHDEPGQPPPVATTPPLADQALQKPPLIPLSPLQILGYLEAGQSIRCLKTIGGFTAGESYPIRQIPVIVQRTIKGSPVSGPDRYSNRTCRDHCFALPDDSGKDRLFIERRHIREGIVVRHVCDHTTEINASEDSLAFLPASARAALARARKLDAIRQSQIPTSELLPLDSLVQHFEITPPPDIPLANPAQLHANLEFLDAIDKLATKGFRFVASLRNFLVRLAIPDCASYEDPTGWALTPMGILWALLKVGLHPQANGTLLPAEPVLILAPSGFLACMLDDYKALFGAATPPVTRIPNQDEFRSMLTSNNGLLKPGFYLSSFTELALNKFQIVREIPDTFPDEPGGILPDNKIQAYMDFFGVTASTYAEGLAICRQLSRTQADKFAKPSLASLMNGHFAAVVIDAGTHLPSEDSIIGRGLKALAPRYRLVLTGPPFQKRLPEPPLRPAMIPDGIRPSCHHLQEPPPPAPGGRFSQASPCPVCGSSECECGKLFCHREASPVPVCGSSADKLPGAVSVSHNITPPYPSAALQPPVGPLVQDVTIQPASESASPQTDLRSIPDPPISLASHPAADSSNETQTEIHQSHRLSSRTPPDSAKPVESKFLIDMRRVEEITRETNEVAAILSPLMDEPSQSPVALPNPPSLTSPEIPKLVPSPPIPPHPTRFIGLDPAFHAILEQLLTRDRWSPADFHALAREFHFMPLRVRDTLNGWSDDAYGDFILDGDDPIIVRRELITKEANLYG